MACTRDSLVFATMPVGPGYFENAVEEKMGLVSQAGEGPGREGKGRGNREGRDEGGEGRTYVGGCGNIVAAAAPIHSLTHQPTWYDPNVLYVVEGRAG